MCPISWIQLNVHKTRNITFTSSIEAAFSWKFEENRNGGSCRLQVSAKKLCMYVVRFGLTDEQWTTQTKMRFATTKN